METVQQFFDLEAFRIPSVRPTDILEILIIAFLVYHVLLWAKNSTTNMRSAEIIVPTTTPPSDICVS